MWFQEAGMNISNVMGSADTSVVAASKKNKWKLTDSLKDKIAEMAKKMHRTMNIWEMNLRV